MESLENNDSSNCSIIMKKVQGGLIQKQMKEIINPEFTVEEISYVITAVAGMGVLINIGAAIFLSYKLKKQNSPFLRLLRALAFSDLCVMVTGTLLHGLPGWSSKYKEVMQPMIGPYLLPLAQTSIMTSVYLAVVMAFERYIRICYICQLRSTRLLTEKNLRLYIWACLFFPLMFYIPKWFELETELGLKSACAGLKKTSYCLAATKHKSWSHVILTISQALSENCWMNSTTPIYEKMVWHMRHTPIRYNKVYYVSYYLTLNTFFATILPIGALLFFSLSTVNGLASIRKCVRTSIPMRMSSSRVTKPKMGRNNSHIVELDPLTSTNGEDSTTNNHQLTVTKSELSLPINPNYKRNSTFNSKNTVAEPSAHEKRLTRISIILIFIYILCHMWKIPSSIYEAWYFMVYDTTTMVPWPHWLHILNDISHVLIQANSAFNFIIYLVL